MKTHVYRSKSQEKSPERAGVGMEITSAVLRALEKVAKASPVPGLSEAAGLALQISETVQKVNNNKEAFQRLAADACELVYVISHAYGDISRSENEDPELEANLDDVLKVLLSIQGLANKGASRRKLKSIWRSGVDAEKIRECRERLQQCLNRFGFESDINIRFMVCKLASQHEKIMGLLGSNDTVASDCANRKEEERSSLNLNNLMGCEVEKPAQDARQTVTFGNNANFAGALGIAFGTNNMVNIRY